MNINTTTVVWVLIGTALVYFMQAGFALCEAGLTRAKNTGNILMKNMMDFCIGTPCYWLVGFGLMFSGLGPIVGGFDPDSWFLHRTEQRCSTDGSTLGLCYFPDRVLRNSSNHCFRFHG